MRSGKYYPARKDDGKKVDCHRAVMEETLGRTLGRNEIVHHINGDINDYRPENLCVMTRAEHGSHHMAGHRMTPATRQRISDKLRGRPKISCRKLTDDDIESARWLRAQGMTYRAIANIFGVSHSTIQDALSGKTYQVGGT